MNQDGIGDVEFGADIVASRDLKVGTVHKNTYEFECFDSEGNLKWTESVKNLVTNEGLDDVLDKYLKGSGYTAAWYVGLVDNASFTAIAATNTSTDIHVSTATNGWIEFDDYSEGVRQTLTLGTVSSQSVDNSASKAAFSIDATGVVNGAFVVDTNVWGTGAGVLYGAASFSATRNVENGDTLNVTVTLTQASA